MARVLIAEDDASVRDFAQRALERQGHVVTAVEDGYAALERLAEAEYDLVVSDVVMPGMDGIELALRVAQSWPEMPVLLMSAFDQEGLRSAGIDPPTGQLLSKPFSLKRFCDAVEAVLGRGKA
jgi:DNA-binding response OmpR family regulator